MVIEPGKSVGAVSLGSSIRVVESFLGMPTSARDIEDWYISEYSDKEIAAAYFFHGELSSMIIVPNEETILWDKCIFRLAVAEIELLLSSHRQEFSRCPSCHPAVRARLDVSDIGLFFYLVEDRCDDILVSFPGDQTKGVVHLKYGVTTS